MSNNGFNANLPGTGRAIRELFEVLLPEKAIDYQEPGWLETAFAYHGSLWVRPPRTRGNALTCVFHKLLRHEAESLSVAERSVGIGRVDVGGWTYDGPQSLNQLTIVDRLYRPQNPVDGNIDVVRHTQARFIIAASLNPDGAQSQNGITFDMVELGESGDVSFGAKAHLPMYEYRSSWGAVERYLTEHNLPPDFWHTGALDVAEFCIAEASSEA
jgi:hypothetical protein